MGARVIGQHRIELPKHVLHCLTIERTNDPGHRESTLFPSYIYTAPTPAPTGTRTGRLLNISSLII